jgi:hypothetical protein
MQEMTATHKKEKKRKEKRLSPDDDTIFNRVTVCVQGLLLLAVLLSAPPDVFHTLSPVC